MPEHPAEAIAEMADLFIIQGTTAFDRWGDYGDILCNGLCLNSEEEPLRLGRAGPSMPPISFPVASRSIVVTDEARQQLTQTGISGIGEFRPAIIEKAVAINWAEWNKAKQLDGDKLPFNGEPEEFILHNAHDESVAAILGKLWVWHPSRIGKVLRSSDGVEIEGVLGKADVFRLNDPSWKRTIVSERGKENLSRLFSEWISFERLNGRILS